MIKVLVVDDSLFMRRLISDMLNSDPHIEVIGTARDGSEALEKIPKIKPDCITLDLVMPGMDGLTTLKHIIAEYPTPIIILSAVSKQDADITMKCLNYGAVGFVLKPSGELSLDIGNVKRQLLEQVKAASKVKVERIRTLVTEKPRSSRHKSSGAGKIIVIGASTGGPQTLEAILPYLPENFPVPIIVVQHLPSRLFTMSLAEHLNMISELEVKIAENNEVIRPGKVYLAPADSQMMLKLKRKKDEKGLTRDEVSVVLMSHATNDRSSIVLSPSIDITMKSVAEIYNGNAIGIILSGMGNDGLAGMKSIKESGGKAIVQDETSLIFGMPKAVIDAGCADKVLGVRKIVSTIMEMINHRKNDRES